MSFIEPFDITNEDYSPQGLTSKLNDTLPIHLVNNNQLQTKEIKYFDNESNYNTRNKFDREHINFITNIKKNIKLSEEIQEKVDNLQKISIEQINNNTLTNASHPFHISRRLFIFLYKNMSSVSDSNKLIELYMNGPVFAWFIWHSKNNKIITKPVNGNPSYDFAIMTLYIGFFTLIEMLNYSEENYKIILSKVINVSKEINQEHQKYLFLSMKVAFIYFYKHYKSSDSFDNSKLIINLLKYFEQDISSFLNLIKNKQTSTPETEKETPTTKPSTLEPEKETPTTKSSTPEPEKETPTLEPSTPEPEKEIPTPEPEKEIPTLEPSTPEPEEIKPTVSEEQIEEDLEKVVKLTKQLDETENKNTKLVKEIELFKKQILEHKKIIDELSLQSSSSVLEMRTYNMLKDNKFNELKKFNINYLADKIDKEFKNKELFTEEIIKTKTLLKEKNDDMAIDYFKKVLSYYNNFANICLKNNLIDEFKKVINQKSYTFLYHTRKNIKNNKFDNATYLYFIYHLSLVDSLILIHNNIELENKNELYKIIYDINRNSIKFLKREGHEQKINLLTNLYLSNIFGMTNELISNKVSNYDSMTFMINLLNSYKIHAVKSQLLLINTIVKFIKYVRDNKEANVENPELIKLKTELNDLQILQEKESIKHKQELLEQYNKGLEEGRANLEDKSKALLKDEYNRGVVDGEKNKTSYYEPLLTTKYEEGYEIGKNEEIESCKGKLEDEFTRGQKSMDSEIKKNYDLGYDTANKVLIEERKQVNSLKQQIEENSEIYKKNLLQKYDEGIEEGTKRANVDINKQLTSEYTRGITTGINQANKGINERLQQRFEKGRDEGIDITNKKCIISMEEEFKKGVEDCKENCDIEKKQEYTKAFTDAETKFNIKLEEEKVKEYDSGYNKGLTDGLKQGQMKGFKLGATEICNIEKKESYDKGREEGMRIGREQTEMKMKKELADDVRKQKIIYYAKGKKEGDEMGFKKGYTEGVKKQQEQCEIENKKLLEDLTSNKSSSVSRTILEQQDICNTKINNIKKVNLEQINLEVDNQKKICESNLEEEKIKLEKIIGNDYEKQIIELKEKHEEEKERLKSLNQKELNRNSELSASALEELDNIYSKSIGGITNSMNRYKKFFLIALTIIIIYLLYKGYHMYFNVDYYYF